MKKYKSYESKINDKLHYIAAAARLRDACTELGRASFVVMADRPGVQTWAAQVEHTWFRPDTEDNDNFLVCMLRWPYDEEPKNGLLWWIVTIPTAYEDQAMSLLWRNGLQAMVGKTHIMLGGKEKYQEFPVQGPHVFPLENHSKGAKNVIYSNDPVAMAKARQHERLAVARIAQAHREWLSTPDGWRISHRYWAKHGLNPDQEYARKGIHEPAGEKR